jgi:hypothetical protein
VLASPHARHARRWSRAVAILPSNPVDATMSHSHAADLASSATRRRSRSATARVLGVKSLKCEFERCVVGPTERTVTKSQCSSCSPIIGLRDPCLILLATTTSARRTRWIMFNCTEALPQSQERRVLGAPWRSPSLVHHGERPRRSAFHHCDDTVRAAAWR